MNRCILLLLSLQLLCSIFCQGQTRFKTIPNLDKINDIDLFILAGQSNMSGRGNLNEFNNTIDSTIFLFANNNEWYYAQEPIDNAYNQIDLVSLDEVAAVSPGLSFARALKNNNPQKKIGLIPTAKGGSALEEWKKGQPLYQSMISRAKAAAKHGFLKGILFFQGETDANAPSSKSNLPLHAADWDTIFAQFVKDVRTDLDNSNLPIVFAQIGKTTDSHKFVNWELVQKQQAAVRLPLVGMISTKDLQLKDYVHFNAKSYIEIGKRFAQRYLEITANAPSRVDAINQSLRNPEDGKVFVCAHRGDWRNAPENSLQAVKNCIDMGIDIVEVDVQKTKDGHLILMHDEKLDRTTTGKGYVKDWTLDSIKTLKLRGGLTNPTNFPIPTLEEVMQLAKGNIMIYLDKADKQIPEMLALLEKTNTLDHAVFMLPYTYLEAKEKFGNYLNRVVFIPRIEMTVEDPQAFIDEYVKNFKPVAIQLRLPAEDSPRVDLIPIIQKQKMRIVVSTIWDYVSANHDDDRAFFDPDAHWGWHVRKGVSIFNTDRPGLLLDYLRSKKLHK